MLLPSTRRDFMDDFFKMNDFFKETSFFPFSNLFVSDNYMKTDVKELEQNFEFSINLPGYHKEDISCDLEKGYLTIRATDKKESSNNEKEKYVRKERYFGSYSRTFYIGEEVNVEEIEAKFENGVLKLTVPKKDEKIETKKFISIQ